MEKNIEKDNLWKKSVTFECTRQQLWLKKNKIKRCTYTHRQQILIS